MKKPITILFDAHPLLGQKTGVGYYTEQLVTELATRYPNDIKMIGYYHNFLLRKKVGKLPQATNLRYRRISWLPGQVVNLLRRLGIAVPIELLTGLHADIIFYSNFWGPPSITKAASVPIVYDLSFYDHPEFGADKNIRDLKRFVPKVLKSASLVITISAFSKRRIADKFSVPSRDILVTPIPPAPATQLSTNAQQQLLTDQTINKPYILFVGTLEPRKNLVELLDAYAALPGVIRKTYSLVIAGKQDWKFAATMNRITEMQQQGFDVRYLGYVADEIRETLYANARLFVLPSFYEGFGMPILEAMRYGTACVVSDIPVFHEVAADRAAYYRLGSSKDLATKIKRALEQTDSASERQARKDYVAGNFSWREVCAAIEERLSDFR